VDPNPDGESWEGAQVPLACARHVFQREEVTGKRYQIKGHDEYDAIAPGVSQGDEYIGTFADAAAAKARAAKAVADIRSCVAHYPDDYGTVVELPAPATDGDVVVFRVRGKTTGSEFFYAVGHDGDQVCALVLETLDDPAHPAEDAFARLVTTAMNRLRS
jgi:hypothetical protein